MTSASRMVQPAAWTVTSGVHLRTGVVAYDRAGWEGWVPQIENVLTAGPVQRLIQRTPPDALGNQSAQVAPHFDRLVLIHIPDASGVTASIAGTSFKRPPEPAVVAVLPSGPDSYWSATPESTDGVGHVHLDLDFVGRIAEADHRSGSERAFSPQFGPPDPMIAPLMQAILHEPASSPRLWWETMATALVLRLLRVDRAVAPARPPARGGIAPRALKRVQDYILAHLADEIGLEELAAIAGLSPFHFCRAFKQSTGLPPHGWIVTQRIERAKALMATHPAMGLLEIALCVGYQNQSTFGASFSRIVGMTPGRWRRERTI